MIFIKNIEELNENKKRQILVVFNDMITNMLSNKKFNQTVTWIFIGGRKSNVSLLFMTQSYFGVPKDIRLYSTHFFVMKISNKK